jgi:serine/threonine protein kinase
VTVLADRYRLEGVLGRGGVADVYRARDLVLDRDVAVKMLRESVDGSERDRFVGEAKTLARLSHAGLVTVLDVGVSGTQPFLVMELVEGSTLAAALRGGPLPPDRVAALGAELARAVAHAHEQGVIHRDVKPGNVLLSSEGGAKLADFGIARLLGDAAGHTKTGMTIGTPAYLSPEQVRGAAVGPPSDVYSLGLVLLEALTGERAFTGTSIETALARLHRPPRIPEELPDQWRELLAAMTATAPDARPTAAEVGERIEGWNAPPAATRVLDVPLGASAVAGADLPTERMHTTAPSASSQPKVIALLVATALVLAVVAVAGTVLAGGDEGSDDGPGPSTTAPATTASTGPSEEATPTVSEQGSTISPSDETSHGGDEKGKEKGKGKDKGGKQKGGKQKGGKGKG